MRTCYRLWLALVVAFACVTASYAKADGKALADLLKQVLQTEEIHPDSIYPAIRQIETARAKSTDAQERLVYALALGRLYADRSREARYAGSYDYDSLAEARFREVFASLSALDAMKVRDWVPTTKVGDDGDYFGNTMLHVAWTTMCRCNLNTKVGLPQHADMIDYYRKKGNRNAVLLLSLDSLNSSSVRNSEGISRLKAMTQEYADLPLCAEVYRRLSRYYYDNPQEKRAWLQQGVSLYPKYKRINELKNEILSLADPYLNWHGPTVVYPGKTYPWTFEGRNVKSAKVGGVTYTMPMTSDVDAFRDTIQWTAPLTPGVIKQNMTLVPGTKVTEKLVPIEQKIRVTTLQLLYRSLTNDTTLLLVVDADNGHPVEGVRIDIYNDEDSITRTLTTNAEGRAVVADNNKKNAWRSPLRLRMSTDRETDLPIQHVYRSSSWRHADSEHRIVRLFTDRSIYRPGQTLHVGGVVYSQNGWTAQVCPDETVKLTLFDGQGKEVATSEAKTDSLGVVSGTFELPTNRRTGSWRVVAKVNTMSASTYFAVEEYKRPTFDVVLDDSAQVGTDSITVGGKAVKYDGTPLRNARVTATYSTHNWWWGWRKHSGGETMRLDTLQTDKDGRFSYTLKRDTLIAGITLEATALSDYGEQQSASHWYRTGKDRPLPPERVDSTFILQCKCDTFDVGRPARIALSTKLKDIYVFYALSAQGRTFCDSVFHMSEDATELVIPYDEAYGKSASVSLVFVQGEKVYTPRRNLYLAQPDTRLRPRWDTFRDLLTPGQKEEWKLTLLRPDGTPADANLMVTLYDASLDRLKKHDWDLSVSRGYPYHNMSFGSISRPSFDEWLSGYYTQKKFREPRDWDFDQLNESLFARRYRSKDMVLYSMAAKPANGGKRMMKVSRATADASPYDCEEALAENLDMTGSIAGLDIATDQTGGEEEAIGIPLRENFSETAFFYPQLRTNEQGQLSIAFTLPDCITTWRLLGVAHTTDMMTVGLDNEIVARKDLMAQLRLPRFLRPGDETSLTATVSNCGDARQTGKATLQILDAKTERVLKTFRNKVDLQADSDTTFQFPYTTGEGDIIVRWAVEGKACSDGEQRLLTVLPATMAVTNTMALTAYDPCVQTQDLTGLFPESSTNRRITVEYTTHPEQYAVQALPSLAVAKHNDVLSLASAYYAGVLAKNLNVAIPDSCETYLGRLRDLQQKDGSFAWYPGMPGSAYLTCEVGYLMSRLQMLTGDCGDKTMYQNAARYLLGQIPVPKFPHTHLLNDLYTIQNAGLKLSRQEKHKVDSLVTLVKQIKPEQLDLEGQALAAIVLKQRGNDRKAEKMVDAFAQRLVATEQHGTYIEFPQGPFRSIDRKLNIHVQLMEALQMVRPDAAELKGMRRYLLQQKRTQEWSTPVVSAHAIFALLNGQKRVASEPTKDLLTLTCEGRQVTSFVASADSLGYVCDSVLITKAPKTLRLHKTSKGESWGSVYADFDQRFEDVAQSSTGLSVEAIYPSAMQRGQQVTVTHRLMADKDYEYVTMVVPRPASFEPVAQRSGCCWQDGLCYYREVRDACTIYHFYAIPRGHYEMREDFYVERTGTYHSGVPTIRCEYAPEYSAHGTDRKLNIAR